MTSIILNSNPESELEVGAKRAVAIGIYGCASRGDIPPRHQKKGGTQ